MKLQGYTAFFEMLKSHLYLKKTSTPYNGGADSASRLMPYDDESFIDGWKLKEMQKVDFNGRKIGTPITLKTFLQNYAISIESVKTSITAALGELARLSWIENIKVRHGALYASVYLGKFGLEFNGEVYSPVFELPDEGNKSGDTFWLLAAPQKSKQGRFKGDKELEARAIMILDGDLTNDFVMKKAFHAVYQPLYRKWLKSMQDLMKNDPDNFDDKKIKKPGMTEQQFSSAYELIRDTGKKNFFIIFKSGRDSKDLVNAAKRGVRGYGDVEAGKIIRRAEILTNKPEVEKEKIKQSKFFYLSKNTPFWFFQKGGHRNMEENAYNLLTIVGVKDVEKGVMKIEVRNKSNQVFQIGLKAHDKIKIPKETTKVKKFVEAEITSVDNSKGNTRVQIRYLD